MWPWSHTKSYTPKLQHHDSKDRFQKYKFQATKCDCHVFQVWIVQKLPKLMAMCYMCGKWFGCVTVVWKLIVALQHRHASAKKFTCWIDNINCDMDTKKTEIGLFMKLHVIWQKLYSTVTKLWSLLVHPNLPSFQRVMSKFLLWGCPNFHYFRSSSSNFFFFFSEEREKSWSWVQQYCPALAVNLSSNFLSNNLYANRHYHMLLNLMNKP